MITVMMYMLPSFPVMLLLLLLTSVSMNKIIKLHVWKVTVKKQPPASVNIFCPFHLKGYILALKSVHYITGKT